MARFVQRPGETWQQLYLQLLPYLKQLGKSGRIARDYQRLLGQIEQQFRDDDRLSARPLSDLFLAGFSASCTCPPPSGSSCQIRALMHRPPCATRCSAVCWL